MTLRRWQSECVGLALRHYRNQQHFFCQATPAAGKTRMAAELAKLLFAEGKIDAVICFAPACQIVDGFRRTFTNVLGRAFDGRMNAAGTAITYQSIEHQDESFWRLFEELRVFTVFDEIHHCSGGDEVQSPNIWGQRIIQRIQDSASYTLAMSGTPWRSDERSIALARYSSPEGRLIVDYRYSLSDAVSENVCRIPNITLLDHPKVGLKSPSGPLKTYQDFAALLKQSDATFESLVTNPDINRKLLQLSLSKLNQVREQTPDAGGLIVATNISHAHKIATLLQEIGEEGTVVTTHRTDASAVIDDFRTNSDKWIIAVGMISEGTDIPRLSVCCYLSRVRTEMYFRQVMGRILRYRNVGDTQAWMYTLAEPDLQTFSERLLEDLPEDKACCRTPLHVPFDNAFQNVASNVSTETPFGASDGTIANVALGVRLPQQESSIRQANQIVLEGGFRERLLAFF